jgi:hypothetical protein
MQSNIQTARIGKMRSDDKPIPTTIRLTRELHDEVRKALYEGKARSFQDLAEQAIPLWLGIPIEEPEPLPDTTLDLAGLSEEDQDRVKRYASALARGKAKHLLQVIDVALAGAEYHRREPHGLDL